MINIKDTIYNITTNIPEAIEVLVNHGFDKLANPMIRNSIGKTMTLETICKNKGKDINLIIQDIEKAINKSNNISIKGVLPCPIKEQLIEGINKYITTHNIEVNSDLKAASAGLDWIINNIHTNNDVANIYMSAGFSLFFDNKIKTMITNNIFDTIDYKYSNKYIDINLKDPNNNYAIISYVPAIYIVDKTLLNGRPIPNSWSDLFNPIYSNDISVPMKDLDLYNAVLLNLYAKYGEQGIIDFSKGYQKSMHPASVVKNAYNNKKPLVSIVPAFFATMLKDDTNIAIWPSDGAIVSPIFLLAKKDERIETKQVLEYLTSDNFANIINENNCFPSTKQSIENKLIDDKKLMFCGWEFINNNNISELLEYLDVLYKGSI